MIVPSHLTVQEAFLTEDLDPSPTPSCVQDAGDVHILAAGFPNFKLNAYVGLDKSRGQATQVVLDTGSGPNSVREDIISQEWEHFRRPLRVRF